MLNTGKTSTVKVYHIKTGSHFLGAMTDWDYRPKRVYCVSLGTHELDCLHSNHCSVTLKMNDKQQIIQLVCLTFFTLKWE